MSASRSRQLSELARQPLVRNALFLTANEVSGAALGFAFWFLAARLFLPDDVGRGTALIGLATFLAIASTLGFNIALVRFVPRAAKPGPLVWGAIATTVAAAIGVSVVYLLGAPLWTPDLAPDLGNPVAGVAFLAIVVVWATFLVLDGAFVGAGTSGRVLVRGIVFNGAKIGFLLPLAAAAGVSFGIVASWGLGLLVANVLGLIWLGRSGTYGPVRRSRGRVREMARYAVSNHVANLFGSAPAMLLPVLVVHVLGPDRAAHFYIAWVLATLLFMVPNTVHLSVLAEGSRFLARVERHRVQGIALSVGLLVPAAALALVLGEPILLLFRAEYASALPLFQLLVIASFPMVLTVALLTHLRTTDRLGALVALSVLPSLTILLGSAALLPAWDLAGIGWTFLVTHLAVAAVAVVWLLRPRRNVRMPTPHV